MHRTLSTDHIVGLAQNSFIRLRSLLRPSHDAVDDAVGVSSTAGGSSSLGVARAVPPQNDLAALCRVVSERVSRRGPRPLDDEALERLVRLFTAEARAVIGSCAAPLSNDVSRPSATLSVFDPAQIERTGVGAPPAATSGGSNHSGSPLDEKEEAASKMILRTPPVVPAVTSHRAPVDRISSSSSQPQPGDPARGVSPAAAGVDAAAPSARFTRATEAGWQAFFTVISSCIRHHPTITARACVSLPHVLLGIVDNIRGAVTSVRTLSGAFSLLQELLTLHPALLCGCAPVFSAIVVARSKALYDMLERTYPHLHDGSATVAHNASSTIAPHRRRSSSPAIAACGDGSGPMTPLSGSGVMMGICAGAGGSVGGSGAPQLANLHGVTPPTAAAAVVGSSSSSGAGMETYTAALVQLLALLHRTVLQCEAQSPEMANEAKAALYSHVPDGYTWSLSTALVRVADMCRLCVEAATGCTTAAAMAASGAAPHVVHQMQQSSTTTPFVGNGSQTTPRGPAAVGSPSAPGQMPLQANQCTTVCVLALAVLSSLIRSNMPNRADLNDAPHAAVVLPLWVFCASRLDSMETVFRCPVGPAPRPSAWDPEASIPPAPSAATPAATLGTPTQPPATGGAAWSFVCEAPTAWVGELVEGLFELCLTGSFSLQRQAVARDDVPGASGRPPQKAIEALRLPMVRRASEQDVAAAAGAAQPVAPASPGGPRWEPLPPNWDALLASGHTMYAWRLACAISHCHLTDSTAQFLLAVFEGIDIQGPASEAFFRAAMSTAVCMCRAHPTNVERLLAHGAFEVVAALLVPHASASFLHPSRVPVNPLPGAGGSESSLPENSSNTTFLDSTLTRPAAFVANRALYSSAIAPVTTSLLSALLTVRVAQSDVETLQRAISCLSQLSTGTREEMDFADVCLGIIASTLYSANYLWFEGCLAHAACILPNGIPGGWNGYSVSMWINPSCVWADGSLLYALSEAPSSASSLAICLVANGKSRQLVARHASAERMTVVSIPESTLPMAEGWHHIAIVHNITFTAYIDGRKCPQADVAYPARAWRGKALLSLCGAPPEAGISTPPLFGMCTGARFFEGYLSEKEVERIFLAGPVDATAAAAAAFVAGPPRSASGSTSLAAAAAAANVAAAATNRTSNGSVHTTTQPHGAMSGSANVSLAGTPAAPQPAAADSETQYSNATECVRLTAVAPRTGSQRGSAMFHCEQDFFSAVVAFVGRGLQVMAGADSPLGGTGNASSGVAVSGPSPSGAQQILGISAHSAPNVGAVLNSARVVEFVKSTLCGLARCANRGSIAVLCIELLAAYFAQHASARAEWLAQRGPVALAAEMFQWSVIPAHVVVTLFSLLSPTMLCGPAASGGAKKFIADATTASVLHTLLDLTFGPCSAHTVGVVLRELSDVLVLDCNAQYFREHVSIQTLLAYSTVLHPNAAEEYIMCIERLVKQPAEMEAALRFLTWRPAAEGQLSVQLEARMDRVRCEFLRMLFDVTKANDDAKTHTYPLADMLASVNGINLLFAALRGARENETLRVYILRLLFLCLHCSAKARTAYEKLGGHAVLEQALLYHAVAGHRTTVQTYNALMKAALDYYRPTAAAPAAGGILSKLSQPSASAAARPSGDPATVYTGHGPSMVDLHGVHGAQGTGASSLPGGGRGSAGSDRAVDANRLILDDGYHAARDSLENPQCVITLFRMMQVAISGAVAQQGAAPSRSAPAAVDGEGPTSDAEGAAALHAAIPWSNPASTVNAESVIVAAAVDGGASSSLAPTPAPASRDLPSSGSTTTSGIPTAALPSSCVRAVPVEYLLEVLEFVDRLLHVPANAQRVLRSPSVGAVGFLEDFWAMVAPVLNGEYALGAGGALSPAQFPHVLSPVALVSPSSPLPGSPVANPVAAAAGAATRPPVPSKVLHLVRRIIRRLVAADNARTARGSRATLLSELADIPPLKRLIVEEAFRDAAASQCLERMDADAASTCIKNLEALLTAVEEQGVLDPLDPTLALDVIRAIESIAAETPPAVRQRLLRNTRLFEQRNRLALWLLWSAFRGPVAAVPSGTPTSATGSTAGGNQSAPQELPSHITHALLRAARADANAALLTLKYVVDATRARNAERLETALRCLRRLVAEDEEHRRVVARTVADPTVAELLLPAAGAAATASSDADDASRAAAVAAWSRSHDGQWDQAVQRVLRAARPVDAELQKLLERRDSARTSRMRQRAEQVERRTAEQCRAAALLSRQLAEWEERAAAAAAEGVGKVEVLRSRRFDDYMDEASTMQRAALAQAMLQSE